MSRALLTPRAASDQLVIQRHTAAGGIAVIAFNRVDGPNTLKGFADLHIAGWRLRIQGCPAHANINGSRWVGLPGKPMTDKAGVPLRDATTGKARYVQLLAFDDGETLRRFSDAAVAALDLYAPGWSDHNARHPRGSQ